MILEPTSLRLKRLSLILFLFFAVLPLSAGLLMGLMQSLGWGALNQQMSFQHWATVWTDPAFFWSLAYSLYIALLSTLLALCLAIVFNIPMAGKKRVPLSLYVPLALPAVVMAFFSYQLLSPSGLLSRLGQRLGLIEAGSDFLALTADTWGLAIIFTHALMSCFFFTLYFRHLWLGEGLDRIGETATNLGAKPAQVLWQLQIPHLLKRSRPMIGLYFIFALGSYEIPLLLGRSFPKMLSVLAVDKLQNFRLADRPEAFVMALSYALLLAIAIYGPLIFKRRRI